MTNPPSIGLPFYAAVAFSFWNLSIEREKEFVKYIKAEPHVLYAVKMGFPTRFSDMNPLLVRLSDQLALLRRWPARLIRQRMPRR